MMLQSWMMKTLAIGSVFLIMFLLAWLWKRMKKKPSGGAVLGFFIGMIPLAILIIAPYNVYVLEGGKNYSRYKALGNTTYTMKSGTKVEIKESLACTIINDSDDNYVLDNIVYGGLSIPIKYLIEANTFVTKRGSITYYFDDVIEDQISTQSSGAVGRNRILLEADFDNEYRDFFEGADGEESPSEKINNLKELLEKRKAEKAAEEAL